MGRGGGGKGSYKGGAYDNSHGHGGIVYSDWVCPMDYCAYKQFGSRERCRICDANPSDRRKPKGGGKGTKPTLAQRQTDLAKANEKHQKREEQLKKELAEARKQGDAAIAGKAAGATNDEEEDDLMDDEESAAEVEKALALARKRRKAMQDAWDDDHPDVVRLDTEIKGLVKKSDEAKPQRVRLQITERGAERCQKQVERKTKALEEVDEKTKTLQSEREECRVALESASAELESARTERAGELQKALEDEAKSKSQRQGGSSRGRCCGESHQHPTC